MPTATTTKPPITDPGYGSAGNLSSYGTPGVGDYTIYPDASPGTNLSDLVGGSLTSGSGTGDTVGGVGGPDGPGANGIGGAVATSGGGGGPTTGGGTTTTTPAPTFGKNPGLVVDNGMGGNDRTRTTPATTTTPGTPAPTYTPQNESVVDAVNRVTSSGNPLMQRAAGIGAAVANSRGLQNSSIAAQSAEKAALDVALPVASQEASQAHQTNLQNLTGEQQTALQQQQNENQTGIAQLQADTSRAVSTQQLAGSSQSAFAQALLAASQSYDSNVSAIMSNPDLNAASRQAALNAAATQRNADFTMVQRVYGVSLGPSGTGGSLSWTGATA